MTVNVNSSAWDPRLTRQHRSIFDRAKAGLRGNFPTELDMRSNPKAGLVVPNGKLLCATSSELRQMAEEHEGDAAWSLEDGTILGAYVSALQVYEKKVDEKIKNGAWQNGASYESYVAALKEYIPQFREWNEQMVAWPKENAAHKALVEARAEALEAHQVWEDTEEGARGAKPIVPDEPAPMRPMPLVSDRPRFDSADFPEMPKFNAEWVPTPDVDFGSLSDLVHVPSGDGAGSATRMSQARKITYITCGVILAAVLTIGILSMTGILPGIGMMSGSLMAGTSLSTFVLATVLEVVRQRRACRPA